MRSESKVSAVLIGAMLGLVIVAGVHLLLRKPTSSTPTIPEPEREFVCYSDGKLVEQHVSVARAHNLAYNEWLIEYTDGNQSTYVQDAGESCQVEEYIPDANSTEG